MTALITLAFEVTWDPGIRGILVDREGLYADEPDRIDTLLALPSALGLAPS